MADRQKMTQTHTIPTQMSFYTVQAFDQITASAMKMIHDNVVRTQLMADAAWRRAVETWLQTKEIITLVQPKTVTRFP